MRRFPALLLVATAFAQPAFADVSRVQSHVTAVTVFPQGAQVTREVDFTAQAGTHELLIADLPATTQLLAPYAYMSVGGTSSVVAIALMGLYIETDF